MRRAPGAAWGKPTASIPNLGSLGRREGRGQGRGGGSARGGGEGSERHKAEEGRTRVRLAPRGECARLAPSSPVGRRTRRTRSREVEEEEEKQEKTEEEAGRRAD